MSLVVLGLSHHGAPLALLEQASLDAATQARLEGELVASEHVTEAVVVSTCNRTEVYAEALTFHGALTDLSQGLARATAVPVADLQQHLFVHYEDRGIAHIFAVASGLDSMAVGESQILGQLRQAFTRAQAEGHVGHRLNPLLQHALRVGKRVHAETGIDEVSRNLVQAGLEHARAALPPQVGIAGAQALVIGAGGMSALAAQTAQRAGVAGLTIVNRSEDRARAVAGRIGAEVRPLAELAAALADADIVISCTGATGRVVTVDAAERAGQERGGRTQVYLDLALPHDVATEVADLPHATRVGLDLLSDDFTGQAASPQVRAATDLVTGAVAAYLTERAAEAVAPTVAALRARARDVVDDELARLERKATDLTDAERAEVRRTLNRVVDKLLHTPTVRVKELAGTGEGGNYARALSELFDLDPRDVSVVSTPTVVPPGDPMTSVSSLLDAGLGADPGPDPVGEAPRAARAEEGLT